MWEPIRPPRARALKGGVCPNFTGPDPIILAWHGTVTASSGWQIVQFLLEGVVWKGWGLIWNKVEDESPAES